jgi:hypothetical protein
VERGLPVDAEEERVSDAPSMEELTGSVNVPAEVE